EPHYDARRRVGRARHPGEYARAGHVSARRHAGAHDGEPAGGLRRGRQDDPRGTRRTAPRARLGGDVSLLAVRGVRHGADVRDRRGELAAARVEDACGGADSGAVAEATAAVVLATGHLPARTFVTGLRKAKANTPR